MTDEPSIPGGSTKGSAEYTRYRKSRFWMALFIQGGAFIFAFMQWGGAAVLAVLLAGVVLADGILRKDPGLEPNEGQ